MRKHKKTKSLPTRRRLVRRDGAADIERIGMGRTFGSDYFHRFLRTPWNQALGILISVYLFANAFFAGLYLLGGEVIENAQPGSFADAFFFSLQTMSTLGYGKLHPLGIYANSLAAIEAFIGLAGFAVGAALVFAKFARPVAKIGFSNQAVIHKRNGVDCLVFRIINERNNQILDASLHATALINTQTKEGERIREMRDLKLLRSQTPIFALTFMVVHPIDQDSPLYAKSLDELREMEVEVIITFTGTDDAYFADIHARHSYILEEILWEHRFVDIIHRSEDGRFSIDYRKFHLTQAITE